MYRPTRIAVVAVAAVALLQASCATMRVHSYADRGADFARYRSYAWAPTDDVSTGDPRLDNNRFFSQRVEEAVDMQLAARGFERTSAAAADLLVRVHTRVDQGVDASTLLVDLIDRRTNTLAWRGWAEDDFDAVIDDQHWMEATIDTAVARILARLPRNVS
jgi:hypothetical protein